jgi:hypothetical protein
MAMFMFIDANDRQPKKYNKRFNLDDWTDREIYKRFRFTREGIEVSKSLLVALIVY